MTPLEELDDILESKYPEKKFGGYTSPYMKLLGNGKWLAKYNLYQVLPNGKTHHLQVARVIHEDSGMACEKAITALLRIVKHKNLKVK